MAKKFNLLGLILKRIIGCQVLWNILHMLKLMYGFSLTGFVLLILVGASLLSVTVDQSSIAQGSSEFMTIYTWNTKTALSNIPTLNSGHINAQLKWDFGKIS